MTDHRVMVKQEPKMLLRAETVAQLTDLSLTVVYDLIRDGRLPSVQIEGTTKRLVPMSVLRAWITDLIKTQIESGAPVKPNAPLDQSY